MLTLNPMSKRTLSGEVLTEIILEIFRLNGSLLEAGNKITKPLNLTSARWQVMGAIEIAKRPLTVAQIARRMGLTRQGVQRIVKDLIKLEMVVSESNPDHKRSPLIYISDKGEKTMIEVNKAQALWVNKIADNISDRELNKVFKILQKIRNRIE